jgi:hypothetical protein
MEIAVALATVLVLGLVLRRLGRRRRAGRPPVAELGGFLTGAVPAAHRDDDARALEEGSLDPDELRCEPAFWDEGADDELG